MLRHGRRALGFRGGIGTERGLELRLLRFPRGRGFVFQQAALDPFHEKIDLRGGELVALGRHLRLGGLFDEVDEGRGNIAGFDDFPGGAAFHGTRKGGEIETAFGLVRVMAIQARLLEEGQDVVVVRDLLLRGKERRGEQGDDGDTEQRITYGKMRGEVSGN